MKRLIVLFLAVIMTASLLCVSVSAEDVDEGELIIRLFDPEAESVSPWQANTYDALSLTEIDGKTVLTHQTWDSTWTTSLSMKRYYEVDWSQYDYDKVMLIADLYVGGTLPFDVDVSGEFKIKHGDSADLNGNTTDTNQFYQFVWDMNLVEGWNHIEMPLCSMYTGGDTELFRTTDWFCLWMKGSDYIFDISIGRLDIVATENTLVTEAPETEAPETKAPETDPPETDAPDTKAPETNAPDTKTPDTEAEEKGGCGSVVTGTAAVIIAVTSAFGCAVIKKRK